MCIFLHQQPYNHPPQGLHFTFSFVFSPKFCMLHCSKPLFVETDIVAVILYHSLVFYLHYQWDSIPSICSSDALFLPANASLCKIFRWIILLVSTDAGYILLCKCDALLCISQVIEYHLLIYSMKIAKRNSLSTQMLRSSAILLEPTSKLPSWKKPNTHFWRWVVAYIY